MRFRALLLFTGLLVTGCTDRTALIVLVTSTTLHVPADIDTLHFQATSASGLMASGDYRVSSPLPQSIAVRPGATEHGEMVTVVVTATLAGTVVARALGTGMLQQGTTTTIEVVLVRCTTACGPMDGGVPDAAMDLGGDAADLGAVDAGPDVGPVDLGRDLGPDLGPTDLGPPDLGPPDLGPPDLGMPGSCATGGCATHLVISEVATGSTATGSDEFVELYNPTAAAIDASGATVEYRSSAGASYAVRATLPAATMIPSHHYYLVGSVAYATSATVVADPGGAWTVGMASGGGHVRLMLSGVEQDRLGWGTAVLPEGMAAPGFSSDSARSYERRAFSTSDLASMTTGLDATHGNSLDTDDNMTDFVVRTPRDPQSSASLPETP